MLEDLEARDNLNSMLRDRLKHMQQRLENHQPERREETLISRTPGTSVSPEKEEYSSTFLEDYIPSLSRSMSQERTGDEEVIKDQLQQLEKSPHNYDDTVVSELQVEANKCSNERVHPIKPQDDGQSRLEPFLSNTEQRQQLESSDDDDTETVESSNVGFPGEQNLEDVTKPAFPQLEKPPQNYDDTVVSELQVEATKCSNEMVHPIKPQDDGLSILEPFLSNTEQRQQLESSDDDDTETVESSDVGFPGEQNLEDVTKPAFPSLQSLIDEGRQRENETETLDTVGTVTPQKRDPNGQSPLVENRSDPGLLPAPDQIGDRNDKDFPFSVTTYSPSVAKVIAESPNLVSPSSSISCAIKEKMNAIKSTFKSPFRTVAREHPWDALSPVRQQVRRLSTGALTPKCPPWSTDSPHSMGLASPGSFTEKEAKMLSQQLCLNSTSLPAWNPTPQEQNVLQEKQGGSPNDGMRTKDNEDPDLSSICLPSLSSSREESINLSLPEIRDRVNTFSAEKNNRKEWVRKFIEEERQRRMSGLDTESGIVQERTDELMHDIQQRLDVRRCDMMELMVAAAKLKKPPEHNAAAEDIAAEQFTKGESTSADKFDTSLCSRNSSFDELLSLVTDVADNEISLVHGSPADEATNVTALGDIEPKVDTKKIPSERVEIAANSQQFAVEDEIQLLRRADKAIGVEVPGSGSTVKSDRNNEVISEEIPKVNVKPVALFADDDTSSSKREPLSPTSTSLIDENHEKVETDENNEKAGARTDLSPVEPANSPGKIGSSAIDKPKEDEKQVAMSSPGSPKPPEHKSALKSVPVGPSGNKAEAKKNSSASGTYGEVSLSFVGSGFTTKVAEDVFSQALDILRPGGLMYVVDLEGNTVNKSDAMRDFLMRLPDSSSFKHHDIQTDSIVKKGGKGTFSRDDPRIYRWIGIKPT